MKGSGYTPTGVPWCEWDSREPGQRGPGSASRVLQRCAGAQWEEPQRACTHPWHPSVLWDVYKSVFTWGIKHFIYAHQTFYLCTPRPSLPGGSDGKESAYNAGDLRFDPWVRKIPLEKQMASHSNILPGDKTMDRGAWQAIVHGVEKSRTWLSNFHMHTKHRCPLSRGILWCLGFQTLETSSPRGDVESESWLTARQLREEPSVKVTCQTVLLICATHSST